MNNFWKRKVPAFLLTLVMLASLAPAALAVPSSTAGGNCTSTAAVNGQHRWDNGTTISRPTCAREGKQVYACQNTGCITAITEPISKTNVHSYKVVSDTATCGASGERLSRCEICQDEKREVSPATGNHKPNANGECTVCHQTVNTPSTTTYTVTYRVGSGTPSSETVNKGGYPARVPSSPALTGVPGSHAFVGWVKGDLSYPGYRNQATTNPGGTTVTGNVTYTAVYRLNATGRNDTLAVGTTAGKLVGTELRNKIAAMFGSLTGESSFSSVAFSTSGSGRLYHNSKQDSLWNNYTYSELSSYVYCVPSTAGNLNVAYTAVDKYSNQISGTITLSGTPKNSSEIVLRVAPGGTVNFKAERFEDAYEELSGKTSRLETVEFLVDSDYKNFDGKIYRGNSSLSAADLDDFDFYVDDSRYGDYDLDALSFRADSRADAGDELEITVRYYDRSNYHYDGVLRVIIDKSGRQEGEVVYRVAPGGSVTFNRSDFNQAYQDLANTSRTLNYIEFVPGDAYTTFGGKISVAGHSDFTKNELSREWFYYSTDRRDSYGIDDLVFRASSGARDGDSLEIPFWASYDRDDEVKCTLRIVIDKNGSQDTVTLNVAPGGTARLDKAAFNKAYQYLSGYSNRTIRAVSFYAPDSYRNFDGALYVKNEDLRLQDLTHDETWFYYSSRDAGRDDYLLEDVTFQADRNARENASLAIPFRAYYSNDREDYEEAPSALWLPPRPTPFPMRRPPAAPSSSPPATSTGPIRPCPAPAGPSGTWPSRRAATTPASPESSMPETWP